MGSKARRLLGELEYYSSQLHAIGAVLVELIQAKRQYPDFISQVADTYRLLTFDLVDVYNALKRVLRLAGLGRGAAAPRIPLEFLETAFVTLRDAAEEADSRAKKVAHYETRAARMSRKAADQIIGLAENAAKILVAEAHQAGQWTIEWERQLGLRPWLR